MKLVTIDHGARGLAGAMLTSGEILNFAKAAKTATLEAWIPSTVLEILQSGPAGMAIVDSLVKRIEHTSASQLDHLRRSGVLLPVGTPLLTPLPYPRLIVAAGLAFKSHLAEMAGTPAPSHPTGFMKTANSVTGSDVPIFIPSDASGHIDYEGELAVVFGQTCHRVEPINAMAHVAGFMAANDVSARDWVKAVWEAKEPWPARLTWETNIMGKQFESFTPMGPVLLTRDEVSDVTSLQITTRLNGKVMQDAPVSDLIFTLEETIAHFSNWYTFHAGDILLTGTPAGVGAGRKPQVFMRAGDVIEVEVNGIGTLRNTLLSEA